MMPGDARGPTSTKGERPGASSRGKRGRRKAAGKHSEKMTGASIQELEDNKF
jgi:hypothetical protein